MAGLMSVGATTPPKKKARAKHIRLFFYLIILFALPMIVAVAWLPSYDEMPRAVRENQPTNKETMMKEAATMEEAGDNVGVAETTHIAPRQVNKDHQTDVKNSSFLRFDWSNLPPMSPLAKKIQSTQSRCITQDATNGSLINAYAHNMMQHGMGSSLHVWSQFLCYAVENDSVLLPTGSWLWLDEKRCPPSTSPLSCYFGHATSGLNCPEGSIQLKPWPKIKKWKGQRFPECRASIDQYTLSGVRAACMEWLFQHVTQVAIDEAERQVKESFGSRGVPPSRSLITVHIRWGDKGGEMELLPVERYINGTMDLLSQDERSGKSPVHIYVASEDPHAIRLFRETAPRHWQVYSSGPTNRLNVTDMIEAGESTKGAAGLESIAALLLSMEADRYVLTTRSNWSRLINELRKNVVDPRCGNCTTIVELHPGGEVFDFLQ
jgi:hypothetical protein